MRAITEVILHIALPWMEIFLIIRILIPKVRIRVCRTDPRWLGIDLRQTKKIDVRKLRRGGGEEGRRGGGEEGMIGQQFMSREQNTLFFLFFTSMEGSACIMSSSTGWVETDERTVGESNVES